MLKIRTILTITMVATILVAAAVVTASAVASSKANQAERRLKTTTELLDTAFERTALRSDWLLFHNERTAAQWRKLHQQVKSLLLEAKQEFKAPPNQSKLELLLGEQPAVAGNFEKLEENWKAQQSGALDPAGAKRVEDQLVGEMTAKAQELVAFSKELAKESRLELSGAVRFGITWPVVLVVALALLVVADTLVIRFSVLRRLAVLLKGAEQVTAGNLDSRMDESGRGEVAELAHAFNDMAGSVKGKEILREGIRRVFSATLTEETENDIAGACLSLAVEITGAMFGFVGLVNERGLLDTKSLSEYGWKKCGIPESEAAGLIQNMELASFWGRVIKEGAPQLVNDPASDPDFIGTPDGHPSIESFLGVPLKDGGETVGIIALANREGGFRTEDLEDLQALGVALTEALNRRRAQDEVRIHSERLEDLVEERGAELGRTRDHLESLLSYASAPMIVWDSEFKVQRFNHAFERFTGYKVDEVVNGELGLLFPEETREESLGKIERTLSGEYWESVEIPILRKDGNIRVALWNSANIYDEDGDTIIATIAQGQDITERELAEKELKRALAELERSNSELQQFAYVASHDLQEPLRMVASYVQLLEKRYKGRLDEDADEFIGYAVDGANRMQRLINDLLALSRVATSKKEIKPTDATLALNLARANLDLLIKERNGVVTNDPLPTVSADEVQLVQLFQNLIANALIFRGEEPPRVHVSARQEGDEWVFSVRDNCIGFEPEHAERIFTIFQRLNPRSEYGGTGIGLAISKSIVERHGGKIWAESVPGEGSTFYFTVPLTQGGAP